MTTTLDSKHDIAARFLGHAHSRPDAVAVVGHGQTLSYRELRDRAVALHQRIVAFDAAAGAPVAILAERNGNLIAAVVAAALSGAPFVVLSTSMWKRDLAKAVAGKILLTEPRFAKDFPGDATLIIGEAADTAEADATAGEIRIAASEARSRAALASFVAALDAAGAPADRVAQSADPTSRGFALEVWAALARGSSLCLLPDVASTAALATAVCDANQAGAPVSLLVTAATANALLDEPTGALSAAASLVLLGTGVEAVHANALAGLAGERVALAVIIGPDGQPVWLGRVSPEVRDERAAVAIAIGEPLDGAALTVAAGGTAVGRETLGELSIRTDADDLQPIGARGRVRLDGRWEAQVSNEPVAADLAGAQDRLWTPTEQRIAELWCEALKLDQVDLHTDFFTLGGNSLLAMRLVAKANEEFDLDVPWAQFLRDPTVAGLASVIDDAAPVKTAMLRPSVRRDAARLLTELDHLSDAQLEALLEEISQ